MAMAKKQLEKYFKIKNMMNLKKNIYNNLLN